VSAGTREPFDAPQALAWARSFMKGVKKRMRDLRALVQGILGKLAPETSLGQPA
jgi:hypothetical protein